MFWNSQRNGWVAVLYTRGSKFTSGQVFDNDYSAAIYFDRMVVEHRAARKLLNFPDKVHLVEQVLREHGIIPGGKPALRVVKP